MEDLSFLLRRILLVWRLMRNTTEGVYSVLTAR
jgi:hypothetical protein